MEKENTSPSTIPLSPPQGVGIPDEGAINRALSSGSSEPSQQAAVGYTRIWKFGKQMDIIFRHRKLIKQKDFDPTKIKHVSHGRAKGCQCSACKIYRKEYEDILSKDTKPIEPASLPVVDKIPTEKNPPVAAIEDLRAAELDELLGDVVDEETAAILLDTFRKAGEMYVRGKNLGKGAEKIWEQDEKEMRVLGKLGKKVWDRYASIPDFKHKELALLGIYMSQSVGLRVIATLKIIKENRQSGR